MPNLDSTKTLLRTHTNAFITAVIPQVEKILTPLFNEHPYWMTVFQLSIGLYGFAMALKQEELNEYVTFIQQHPEEFTEEIVSTKAFRDGFVIALQDYLKIRTEQKKKIAKQILLGFAQCSEKDEFELEQLDDILCKISPHGLEVIKFLKDEVLPFKKSSIRNELLGRDLSTSDKNFDWWLKLELRRQPMSDYLSKLMYERYNPNSAEVRQKYGVDQKWEKKLEDEVFEIERSEMSKIYTGIDELVYLGVLKQLVESGGTFNGRTESKYEFTKMGCEFLKYLHNIS